MIVKESNQFFIVGGQRCGTTYLYEILDEHPEICMAKPLRPEPKFFLLNDYKKTINCYRNLFYKDKEAFLYGEKSTTYYEDREVPKRIKNTFPDSIILFILRNPVDRALSNYFFSKKNGFETRSLTDVFLEKKNKPKINRRLSADPFNYIERGMYYKYIKNYFNFFKREKVHVLISENFVGNSYSIRKLYNYLSINCNFTPSILNKKINSVGWENTDELQKVSDILKDRYYKSKLILEDLIGCDISRWS